MQSKVKMAKTVSNVRTIQQTINPSHRFVYSKKKILANKKKNLIKSTRYITTHFIILIDRKIKTNKNQKKTL